MKIKITFIAIMSLAFFLAWNVNSTVHSATISGTVTDSIGGPITGHEVILQAGDPCGAYDYILSDSTNSSGVYEINIDGVIAGEYYLQSWNNGQNDYINEWWNGDSLDPSNRDCER